jgi:hypothetical protein
MVNEVKKNAPVAIFAEKELMTSEMDTIRVMIHVTMTAARNASEVESEMDAIRFIRLKTHSQKY